MFGFFKKKLKSCIVYSFVTKEMVLFQQTYLMRLNLGFKPKLADIFDICSLSQNDAAGRRQLQLRHAINWFLTLRLQIAPLFNNTF